MRSSYFRAIVIANLLIFNFAASLGVGAEEPFNFNIRDFLNGNAEVAPLTQIEQKSHLQFMEVSSKIPLSNEDTILDLPRRTFSASQYKTIKDFNNDFQRGNLTLALSHLKNSSISDLRFLADKKFDFKLGICLLAVHDYEQAVEYLERYAFYNNESIEGWRAMMFATRLSGKRLNLPEFELGFATKPGRHYPLKSLYR